MTGKRLGFILLGSFIAQGILLVLSGLSAFNGAFDRGAFYLVATVAISVFRNEARSWIRSQLTVYAEDTITSSPRTTP